ncbi:MAG: hypothetical protein ACI4TX_00505 [Christensenellales bacterium]
MKIILNLNTTQTSKVTINENNFFITENETRKLLLKFDNKFYLQVFPIDDDIKYAPFIAMLEYKDKTLKSKSNQISIIKFSDYVFEIIISPTNTLTPNKAKAKRTIKTNKAEKQINYENGKLEIKSNNKVINFNINLNLTNPKISYTENHIMLSSKEKIGTHLYVIDERDSKLKYIYCTEFKTEQNELICLTKLNDYAKHLQITKYNLQTGINLTDSYTAYKTPPKQIKAKKIIPYAFMQNIKAKDLKEARKYLEPNFNQTLTNESLTSFFGNFTNLAPPQIALAPNTVCLIYKEGKNNYISRYFNFEFDTNNKITNIHEIYS